MEARDVFADHVQRRGPPSPERRAIVIAEPQRRDVVDERVEPDVHHALRVERQRDAPGLPCAADGDVVETALDDVQDFVAPDVWLQELGMLRVVVEERLLVLREAEEVVLLLDPVGLRAMHRAEAVDEVLLLLEGLAGVAVPAFVVPLVDVAGGPDALDQRGHADTMALLRGPDEVVERHVEPLPDLAELRLHPIAVGLRVEALLLRAAEHVQRVLVVAHQEVGVDARQPLVARDDVGGDLLVRRAEVRPAVHVVDGGRDVELGHGETVSGHRIRSGARRGAGPCGILPSCRSSSTPAPTAGNASRC